MKRVNRKHVTICRCHNYHHHHQQQQQESANLINGATSHVSSLSHLICLRWPFTAMTTWLLHLLFYSCSCS